MTLIQFLFVFIIIIMITSTGALLSPLIYGTAWKKERTMDLVIMAVKSGFRSIDTACQPKHYNESGVGNALQFLFDSRLVRREDMFIQTKFTSLNGQDPDRIPYDANALLESQVQQSLDASLRNLRIEYIDSMLLHSPMKTFDDTLRVWRIFENFVQSGKVKQIGISNCYEVKYLERLYETATIKPSYIQNRFYAKTDYDKSIRQFCRDRGIVYQSFWTLTANPRILTSSALGDISRKYHKTPEQIFFRYLLGIGIHPLTGTSSQSHMEQDLEAIDIALDSDEELAIHSLI